MPPLCLTPVVLLALQASLRRIVRTAARALQWIKLKEHGMAYLINAAVDMVSRAHLHAQHPQSDRITPGHAYVHACMHTQLVTPVPAVPQTPHKRPQY